MATIDPFFVDVLDPDPMFFGHGLTLEEMSHASTAMSGEEVNLHNLLPFSGPLLPSCYTPRVLQYQMTPPAGSLPPMLPSCATTNPAVNSMGSSSGDDREDSPEEEDCKPTKQARRSAHNLIERRYRNNINDRINELKDMLPAMGTKKKMNKQLILRKGIEYIRALETKNQQLESEVAHLRAMIDGGEGMMMPNAQQLPPSPSASSLSGSSSLSPGSPTSSSGGSSSSMLADGTRVLMCVLLCGLVVLTPFAPANSGAHMMEASGAPGAAAAGGRVLAEATASAAPAAAFSVSSALLFLFFTLLQSWLACGVLSLAALVVIFLRDPASAEVDAGAMSVAREALRTATAANAVGYRERAKRHATRGLLHLGFQLPSSRTEALISLAWQSIRQLLHRVAIGRWIDCAFTSPERAELAARLYSMLHQLQLNDGSALPELAGLQALNLIESVTQPDQSVLAEVYAATAVHAELRTRGQFSLVTRWYWLLAKRAQARRMDIKLGDRAHNSLQWLFEPMGFQFLIRGRFSSKQVRDTFGQRMPPGSLEHAARAFRLDILKRGVDEMLTTGDPDKCTELFNELVAWSSDDANHKWWAMMGLTVVAWRTGKVDEARQYLIEAELLDYERRPLHSMVFAAFSARQALFDRKPEECWELCTKASKELLADQGSGSELHKIAQLVAFRTLLEARVGLYQLTTPAAAVKTTSAVTPAMMLAAAQTDAQALLKFKDQCAVAEPVALMFQAVLRHLAGGSVRQTEHLFNMALKTARRLDLPYDEGVVLLQSAICLRLSTPQALLREKLERAETTFSKVHATSPLVSVRRLMHSIRSD